MKTAKHNLKRYLAFLLALALVMSNISVTAYAEGTTSVPDDEVNITQEETFSDSENDASSDFGILEDENADSSGVEIFDDENEDSSAEQSLEDELIEDNPMEMVSDDQESDISDAASENNDAGTYEESTLFEDENADESSAEEEAEEEPVAFDQSQTVNNMVVTVKADPGVFPADAALSVELVPVRQQEQADAAVEKVRGENQNVAVSYTFDIKVIDPKTGIEYQPAEGQNVSVSFALVEVADTNLETNVYHVTEDESTCELSAEALDVTLEDEVTAVVETDGFSLYTVEFTYNALEYVLSGDSSVALSEILQAVGLSGEVTDVAVSNESLFSVSDETGEWIVTAHQAFDTTEWMTVTIGGVTYQITVTDDGEAETRSVDYVENGSTKTAENVTALTADSTTWTSGWYAVTSDVKISERVEISGTVYLILCDGATLKAEKGIHLSSGNRLTIYGQSEGTGKLNAVNGVSNQAAIGGNTYENCGEITINGGQVEAEVSLCGKRYASGAAIGGDVTGDIVANTITISAGTVIGNLSGETVTVSGGAVTGDIVGNTITISRGTVTANGSNGIKATGTLTLGCGKKTDSITASSFTGGTVIIQDSQRLGDGETVYNGTLDADQINTLSGKTLRKAYQINYLSSSKYEHDKDYAVIGEDVTITPKPGYMFKNVSVGGQIIISAPTDQPVVFQMPETGGIVVVSVDITNDVIPYVDANGSNMTPIVDYIVIDGSKSSLSDYRDDTTKTFTWFVVKDNVSCSGLVVNTDANLILCDGASLTISSGSIQVYAENELTIWGQKAGTGALNVTGASGKPALRDDYREGPVNINGGTLNLTGGSNASGIGGYGSWIRINGGTVTANGGSDAAGIGSESWLYFNGGKINASGASHDILVAENCGIEIAGNPTITGDVYLPAGKTIAIAGTLTNSTPIAVSMETPGVFTSGLNGKGNAENFTSADENYTVRLTERGEAELVPCITVTYDVNGGQGEAPVDSAKYASGDSFKVLSGEGLTKDGYTFYNWNTQADGTGTSYEPGEEYQITENLTFYAQWTHEHDGIEFQPWTSSNSLPGTAGNYFLMNDVTLAYSGTGHAWTVPTGTVNLCLHGHTIANEEGNNNAVIYVGQGATLNLYDDAEDGGKITGGYMGVFAEGGTFCMHGGTITGCSDGVDCNNGGSFTMTGGTITGNSLCGVEMADPDNGSFSVSGSPIINNNGGANEYYTGKANVCLNKGSIGHYIKITVQGPLTEDALIGVTLGKGGGGDTITSGLSGNGDASNFLSDDQSRIVWLNDSGEARLATFWTVTFDSDGGSEVEAQKIAKSAKATRPDDPTKEGSTFKGWYKVTAANPEILEETEFDFENTAIKSDITLKAVWQSDLKLAVYSTDTKFGGSVANVTVSPVKTGYKTGESVTVTAEEKQGYTFLGWYAVTGVSESRVTGYGDKLAETLAYTFDITKDTQITAVYEAKGKATVKIIAVNGAKYMVGDDTTIKTGSQENVPIGTTLKLTAADADQVFQWQNESEKILGTGSTLEYYVTSNTTITLVYQYDAENQSYVQFVSDYGQVLSYNQYSVSSTIDFPVSPTKYGYTFDKWVFEGTEDEATAETIKAKIGTEKIITLKPKYTKDEAVGSVTVNYKAGDTEIAEASVTADIPVGNTKTFAAQDIDGYTFECWKSEDGTVLGYKKDYFMQVTGEHVLNACYVAEGVEVEEAKPTIVIGELEKVTSGSTHKVRGSVTRSIPEGYTLIEHGILYARDKSGLNEETFVYSDGTDGIGKYHATDTAMNGVVGLGVKVASDNVVVSLRGYMVLKNDSTEEVVYYYTDIKEGSFQSIK